MSFDQAFALTISPAVEGAYSCVASDPGNWTTGVVGHGTLLGTQWGVSAEFLYALPSDDKYFRTNPKSLALSDCQAIYKAHFWDCMQGDQLGPTIAGLLFDAAVNQGPSWAPRCLQAALGVSVDGVLGPKTLAAARGASQKILHAEIARIRGERYRADKDWPTDGVGWMRRLMTVVAASSAFT